MIENYISNENKRLLKLFDEYDDVINTINKEINYYEEPCGLLGLTICRNNFSIITKEMESYFKGRDSFDIEIDWNINCSLFEVNWDYKSENDL